MTKDNKRSGGVGFDAEEVRVGGSVIGRDSNTNNSGNLQSVQVVTESAEASNTKNQGFLIIVLAIVAVIVVGLVVLVLVLRQDDQSSGQSLRLTPAPSSADKSTFLPSLDASNLVRHFDLATSTEGWEDIIRFDADWNNGQTFKDAAILASAGEHGLGYDLRLDAGSWLNYVVRYPDPVQADVVVARFYLPDSQNIDQNWIGIQATEGTSGLVLARTATPVVPGEWTQLILDLRGKYDANDAPLSNRPLNLEVFYSVKGKKALTKDTIRVRLADIAWYKNVGEEVGTQLEQRGAGRLLYDFENDYSNWQVSEARVPTDTVELSYDQAHRGEVSLKLNTQLASGDNSFVSTTWRKFVPQGGWIANIYLPSDAPADTRIWANFYTYSQSDWQDSPSIVLTKGTWNTILWDTHTVDWGEKTDITIGIQIGVEGGSYNGPIYIDDVQAFER